MKYHTLVILLLLPFFLLSQESEKRLALVIGNSNYEKGELKNPVNDARLIASSLDSLNFDVILKENLETKREMMSTIKDFGSKRSDYDVAFIYYAGHGIQIDDENFLLPTKEVFNEEFDVVDYGVSVQSIMRYLRAQADKVNIIILDACRDNPFESNWNATRSLKGGGLAKIPPPTGTLIAFSTDSGKTAADGDEKNSTYSVSLAKNLLLEDTTIDQVFRNVRAEVLAETNGAQRPVEATQLVGKSFVLKKNFSIYNSSVVEIINYCDKKILNSNFDEALEILNSAADIFRSKKEVKKEVILRKKIINEYLFNQLDDGLPKYMSLYARTLNYQNIKYEDYLNNFKEKEYDIFIKNFVNLLTNQGEEYVKHIDKGYFINLYRAFQHSHFLIEFNYFSLDVIKIPQLDFKVTDENNDALSVFWKAKNKHLVFRTNPFNSKDYLITNHYDMNKIIIEETKKLVSEIDYNVTIEKSDINDKLFDYTTAIYGDIERSIKQIILDIIANSNSNNTEELFDLLENSAPNYSSFFAKKSFQLDNYPDFNNLPWYLISVRNQISRGMFYSSLSDERLSLKIEELNNIKRYIEFLSLKLKSINFGNKESIKIFNSFIIKSGLDISGYLNYEDVLLSEEDFEKFGTNKKIILDSFDDYLSYSNNRFSIIKDITDKNHKLLENKEFFTEWPLSNHELLYTLILDYLKKSDIEESTNSSFYKKMFDFEKEYKQNYINEVWASKYNKFLKSDQLNHKKILINYEFLTSLKLTESLIELNYGSSDDILFLNYTDLHNKLIVSQISTFCFNPFDLKEKLSELIEKSEKSQNFLIKIFLEELNQFFLKDNLYYINCLKHFSEDELKDIFLN